MADEDRLPQTLLEAVRYFSDPDRAFAYVVERRWPNGQPVCPTVPGNRALVPDHPPHLEVQGVQASVLASRSGPSSRTRPLGFDKWLPAMWLIANSKNSISSYEVGRAIGVTQKTAWFMLHRIRHAMAVGSYEKLDGTVEADETFVGGIAKNMHASVRRRRIPPGTHDATTPVEGPSGPR